MEYTQKPVVPMPMPAPVPIAAKPPVLAPAPIVKPVYEHEHVSVSFYHAPTYPQIPVHMPCMPCGFSSAGVILVLFILLVIISRSRV